MSRAGRRRKLGQRYPNGQVRREVLDSPKAVAATMPHRLMLALDSQTDQRAESRLGRMRLRGQISENQYLAGQQFAKVVGAYLATIAPPASLAGRGKGFDCPGLPDCPNCICARRRASYTAAHDHVMAMVGRWGITAINKVVINDQPCPQYLLKSFEWGLSALSQHFGIGK